MATQTSWSPAAQKCVAAVPNSAAPMLLLPLPLPPPLSPPLPVLVLVLMLVLVLVLVHMRR